MACDHWLDMMFHIKLQMKAKAAVSAFQYLNFIQNII